MNESAATLPRGILHVRAAPALHRVVGAATESSRHLPSFIVAATYLWASTCLATNLKVEFLPYIDWYLFVPVLIWSLGHFKPDQILARSLFLLALLIGGILADNLLGPFIWITKLTMIFVTLSSLRFWPALNRILWCALVTSLYANAACLVMGELGLASFTDLVSGDGRMGTPLNLPGSLWHVGMSLVFNYLYLLFSTPKHRLWNLMSFIACLYVIFSDGGRTPVLFIMMIPCILFGVFAGEGRLARLVPFAVCVVLVAVVVVTTFEFAESVAITRIMPILTGQTQDAGGLEAFDTYRFQMLQKASDLIYEHPILGNGFQSATIMLESEGTERAVVHNAYLQIWADFGLLGLLSFLVIVFGWITQAPAWLRTIAALRDPRHRARYYNAIFTLLWFGLSLLFHPFSSEWSEWILFLLPTCLLVNLSSATDNRGTALVAVK